MTAKTEFTDDPCVDSVIESIIARSAQGMQTYGKSIRDNSELDISGWLNHAQEEMTDAAVYLEKIKEELTLYEYHIGLLLSYIKLRDPEAYDRLITTFPPNYRNF